MISRVITINLATGKTHDTRTCKINTPAGQRWLIGHMNWAMNNGFGIQMLNDLDSEPGAIELDSAA